MKHEISIEDDVVLVIVSGPISPEGYAAVARDVIRHPEWKSGMKVLIDYAYLDLKDETGTDAHVYAEAVLPYKKAMGSGRVACVNTQPVNFGLGRMWQIFMEEFTDLEVGIFYSFKEAMQWLSQGRETV